MNIWGNRLKLYVCIKADCSQRLITVDKKICSFATYGNSIKGISVRACIVIFQMKMTQEGPG